MRYVSINSVPNLSTGSIMRQITEERRSLGDECWCIWGRGRAARNDYEFNFGRKPEFYLDVLQTRIDGRAGFHSKLATRRLLKKLDEIKPDVIHLHNLHGYYVNIDMLFSWLAEHETVQVKWTLHDCWAFTGHCTYFTRTFCDEWKIRCGQSGVCPQIAFYPKTIAKNSCTWNFDHKKTCFTQLPANRMQLITPSLWLKNLVMCSFLSKYAVVVHHNTIDTMIFRPTKSNFRSKHRIGNRIMILGVASPWSERKGLVDFIRLSRDLDQREFAIVLVGLDRKQLREIPDEIIGLERTETQSELVEIYSSADYLFNPTQEDNYPTVNLEAEACGLPVITYDTGGCSETINLSKSQVVNSYEEALDVFKIEKEHSEGNVIRATSY